MSFGSLMSFMSFHFSQGDFLMRFQRLSTLALALLLALATAARAQTPPWSPIGPFGGFVDSITADPVTPGVL